MTGPRGMQNQRDVGGLATADGRIVRTGVLLRSDSPLPGDPSPVLDGWPPATVIDLRSETEWPRIHPLEAGGAVVHRVSFDDGLNATRSDPTTTLATEGLAGLYRATLTASATAIVESIGIIAEAELPLLVHCVHGKDRTGILVALVLDAVGVSREQIMSDYAATAPNMAGVLDRHAPAGTDLGDKVRRLAAAFPEAAGAPEHAMKAVFDAIDALGGTVEWLAANGLDRAALVTLRNRLTILDDRRATPRE